MAYRIVYTDHTFDELDVERELLATVDAEVIDGEQRDVPLPELVKGADAILVMFETVDADLMDEMPECQIISRTGIGLDNIDIDAATERDIIVTNVPDYCIEEVSDHAMAMMLALSRKVVDYTNQVANGGWDVSEGRSIHRLSDQTLGLIGFGNIARRVCQKATSFGLDVLAYDPYLSDEEIQDLGAEPTAALDDMLSKSDIVSVHSPLTQETEGLVSSDELEVMQESAYLINVARGGIVDEDALVRALDAEGIAGAGLDVLVEEPPSADHPLRDHDRVILTPHAAWYSAESVKELREKATTNVIDVLKGDTPSYPVNLDKIE